MNKTIITSVAIVTFGFVFVADRYIIAFKEKNVISKDIASIEKDKATIEKDKAVALKTETRDRFTVCIETVMTQSRQSNKPLDAEKAKEICKN